MTEFERIKAMDITDLAIFINKLQEKAIEDYETLIAPKSIVENIAMLKNEAATAFISVDDKE